MIELLQKQKIILKHIEGMSNRAIAKELHISKDTVNKYIKEYQNQKSELLQTNPEMDPSELIQAIVEKPKYNSDGCRPTKVTPEMMEEIEALLELNRKKRAEGRQRGVDDVAGALIKLERISPLDMSRDKVIAICDYASQTKCSTKKNYTDALSEESRTSLSLYNKLANLQFER